MRREKKWKIPELEIQKKQKEISSSINVSQITNQNLIKKNFEILDENERIENIQEILKRKTIEYKEKEEQARIDCLNAENELKELNTTIKATENKKNLVLDAFNELETRYSEKREKQTKDFNSKKELYLKDLEDLKQTNESLKSENKDLSKEIWENQKIIDNQDKQILENTKKITDHEDKIESDNETIKNNNIQIVILEDKVDTFNVLIKSLEKTISWKEIEKTTSIN